MKRLLNDVVNDAHKHSVETEDDHGADGNIDNDLGYDLVSAAPEVDDGKDGKETNDEVEGDVNDDVTLIDMPIEKGETKDKCGDANEVVFFEVRSFQITGLA